MMDRRPRCLITVVTFVMVAAPMIARGDDTALLFNGKTLDNWSTLDGAPISRGWRIVDDMVYLQPTKPRAGHIISRREFGDFRLSFEWKIAPGGNSGLKYRVRDYGGKIRGCEYQIIDDFGLSQVCSTSQQHRRPV